MNGMTRIWWQPIFWIMGTSAMVEAAACSEPPVEYQLGGKQYVVKPLHEFLPHEFLKDLPKPPAVKQTEAEWEEWSDTFFLYALGPQWNTDFGLPEAEKKTWQIRGISVHPPTTWWNSPFGPTGTLLFERPLTRKWNRMETIPFGPERGIFEPNLEMISIRLGAHGCKESISEMWRRWHHYRTGTRGGAYMACLPKGKDLLSSMREGIFFFQDFFAEGAFHNISMKVYTNFSDQKWRRGEEKTQPPISLMVFVFLREYLLQPFPQPEKILYKNASLIEDFSVSGDKKLAIGQPAALRIALGPLALMGAPEIVRLRTDNGGFQRKDSQILYRPRSAGKANLVLEVFCGGTTDGKFAFAEKRELAIPVHHAPASN